MKFVKPFVFSFLLTVLVGGAIVLFRGEFNAYALSDAFFYPAFLLLSFPLLLWIGRSGTFDVTTYALTRWVQSIKKQEKVYKDAAEYHEAKEEKRKKHKPAYRIYFLFGGINLLFAILFLILG